MEDLDAYDEAIFASQVSPEGIRERVAMGANMLDQYMPGWHERINANDLEIRNCAKCVLGQLFQNFQSHESGDFLGFVAQTLNPHIDKEDLYFDSADGGFHFATFDVESEEDLKEEERLLNAEWIRVIHSRVNPDNEH